MLGGALLWLSAPRTVAESALAIAAPAIRAWEQKGTTTDRPTGREAVTWSLTDLAAGQGVSARASANAGRLRVVASRGSAAPDALLAVAAGRFAQALAAAPLDSLNWYRYAHVNYAAGLYLEAARAWKLSVLTGAFDPDLMFARVESGLALWPYMDLEGREAFGRQLLVHWTWGPDGLAEVLHRFGGGEKAAQVMAAWPEASADLQRRLQRLRERG